MNKPFGKDARETTYPLMTLKFLWMPQNERDRILNIELGKQTDKAPVVSRISIKDRLRSCGPNEALSETPGQPMYEWPKHMRLNRK